MNWPSEEEIQKRLRNKEDNYVERKSEGLLNYDIRKTLVAFANSIPLDQFGILFIGIEDGGNFKGVSNADKKQKDIRLRVEECFPPIRYQCRVITEDEKDILAVIVPGSSERPHFTGKAYIRIGSQSKEASNELYENLIDSRHSLAGILFGWKQKNLQILVKWRTPGKHLVPKFYMVDALCEIVNYDAHRVHLKDISSERHFSLNLDQLRIDFDHSNGLNVLTVLKV